MNEYDFLEVDKGNKQNLDYIQMFDHLIDPFINRAIDQVNIYKSITKPALKVQSDLVGVKLDFNNYSLIECRQIIKAKAIKNKFAGTFPEIQQAIKILYPNNTVKYRHNSKERELTLVFDTLTDRQIQLITDLNLIPVPPSIFLVLEVRGRSVTYGKDQYNNQNKRHQSCITI